MEKGYNFGDMLIGKFEQTYKAIFTTDSHPFLLKTTRIASLGTWFPYENTDSCLLKDV